MQVDPGDDLPNNAWSGSTTTVNSSTTVDTATTVVPDLEREPHTNVADEVIEYSEKGQHLASSRLGVQIDPSEVDEAAHILVGTHLHIEPHDALRIKKRIDRTLLPLMCTLYLMQFVGRGTLSESANLGLIADLNLSSNQFSWLGTIFWIAYLLFQFPQALALQKFHIGHWMGFNIFIWGLALGSQAACKNFGSLLVARFALGMCQSTIPAGFMIINTSFYTRPEQPVRVGYWFSMSGVSVIVLNFIAFGVDRIPPGRLASWQWLMIITGLMTLIVSPCFWFLFPDSPTTAWFLTPEDRRLALIRIKGNQTGVGNKLFKWKQFNELLHDPKTWLFALLGALTQIPTSITNQRSLIISQFTLTPIQTTVLNSVEGTVEFVSIITAVKWAVRYNNNRAYTGALWALPGITGAALVATLPFSNAIGLLFSYWTSLWIVACFPVMLGWMSSTTAGHTKRVLTNATVLSAFGLGNALGPLMWQVQYRPRNELPWSVVVAFELGFASVFLLMRVYLNSENGRRNAEKADEQYDNVYMAGTDAKGEPVHHKVEKFLLDLTDRQNRDYRYVL